MPVETRVEVGPSVLTNEDGRMYAPHEVASKILNFVNGVEGTLEPVIGPAPLIPDFGAGLPSVNTIYGAFGGWVGAPDSRRFLILIHAGSELLEFDPHSKSWDVIVGSGGLLADSLPDSGAAQYPTQFEATPGGVAIAVPGHRVYYYDGESIGNLGYLSVPPRGEVNRLIDYDMINAIGLDSSFHTGGIGTIYTDFGATDPYRRRTGRYLWKYAWIDRWGNVSKTSPPFGATVSEGKETYDETKLRYEARLTGIARGSEQTVGRVIYRTKDVENAGTTRYFEVLRAGTPWATIADNLAETWTDSSFDIDLGGEPLDVFATPRWRIIRLAVGRLWGANSPEEPGLLAGSLPGRWGTFTNDMRFYPDPSGAEISALQPFGRGLLVATNRSMFMLQEGDQGGQYRISPLYRGIGWTAPDTVKTLPDGRIVGLTTDGFLAINPDGSVERIGKELGRLFESLNRARFGLATAEVDLRTGEYRCWLPSEGSRTNDLCLVFDGTGWKRRDKEEYASVFVLNDESAYMLGAGDVETKSGSVTGVWVVDHWDPTFSTSARRYEIETSWINSESLGRVTGLIAHIWLREMADGKITVEAFRDWRYGDVVSSSTINTQATADRPPVWDSAILDKTGNRWVRRRGFKTKVSIGVPDCEVFKLKIYSDGTPFEFLGVSFEILQKRRAGRGEGR